MREVIIDSVPIIATERLSLRDVTEEDIPSLFELRSNSQLMRYMDSDKPTTVAEARIFYDRVRTGLENRTGISWSITLKDEGDVAVGNIGLFNIRKEHFRTEIGYFLHPRLHRKGLMSEALTAVCNYAFSGLHLHSIEANVNPENIASRKLLEKHGFRQEAYFRESFYHSGKFLDAAIYCLIDPK